MPEKARHYLICAAAFLAVAATAALAGGDEAVSRNGQSPAPALTVRVVDPDGKPIPGVKIWSSVETHPLAITGPDGTFTLHDRYKFEIVAACPLGWTFAQTPPLFVLLWRPQPTVELRLSPATCISGRVVDKAGEPVAGVKVEAEYEGGPWGCVRIIHAVPPPCEEARRRAGLTDAEGRFAFESLEPGWYSIRTSVDGATPGILRRRGAAGRGIEGVEFVLPRRSVPVEGRIVDADGAPVSGATVDLSGALSSSKTETDDAGEFRFSEVLSGKSHLTVEHPDQGWIEQDVEIEDNPLRLDLRMLPVTLVQGRILGPDGAPMKSVYLQEGERYFDVAPDGTFRFTVHSGEHEIVGYSFEHMGTVRTRFAAQGEPIDLELRLQPGTLRVRLTGIPQGERGYVD